MAKKIRPPIPSSVEAAILLANRHACCVCQKIRVQIHHIDGDPTNNDLANLACLCHDHHDMATMTTSLTKKLKPNHVRSYKIQWEGACAKNIYALSRERFSFFYSMYKNPPRIREAIMRLSDAERKRAVEGVRNAIGREASSRPKGLFGDEPNNPGTDRSTELALAAISEGQLYPSYLHQVRMHEADPMYPYDFSTTQGLGAFYAFDNFTQVQLQVLVEARRATPLEDLYKFRKEESLDQFSGRLVAFTGGIWGRDLTLPKLWKDKPVGNIQMRKTINKLTFRTNMQINNMYLFSDTASINLKRARASGMGLFAGALREGNEMHLTVVPLLIGSGGIAAL